MTEDEATKKWCPFSQGRVVRWDKQQDRVVNAVWTDPPTILCIAGQCMAWRWLPDVHPDTWRVTAPDGEVAVWNWNPTNHRGYEDYKVEKVGPPPREGGCGLAGRPDVRG